MCDGVSVLHNLPTTYDNVSHGEECDILEGKVKYFILQRENHEVFSFVDEAPGLLFSGSGKQQTRHWNCVKEMGLRERFASFCGFLFSLRLFLLLVGLWCSLLHLLLFFICHNAPLLIALYRFSMTLHGSLLLYQILPWSELRKYQLQVFHEQWYRYCKLFSS
jgi:hypothetical protein